MALVNGGNATLFLPVSEMDAARMKPEHRAKLRPALPSAATLTLALEALAAVAKTHEALGLIDPDADARCIAAMELGLLLGIRDDAETVMERAA